MAKKIPTADELYAYIKKFPGYRMAAYADDFGCTAADFVALRLKLVRSGRIYAEGVTRGATWHAT